MRIYAFTPLLMRIYAPSYNPCLPCIVIIIIIIITCRPRWQPGLRRVRYDTNALPL